MHLRTTPTARRTTLLPALGMMLLVAGCATRDRITTPVSVDGTGPRVTIEVPAGDTTVSPGPALVVSGEVTDADGIDTVYFDVTGGVSSFPPYVADPGQDTVLFQIPLTTQGLPGDTMFVQVRAVDVLGATGSSTIRTVVVK